MPELITHFDISEQKGIVILNLKENESNEFLGKLPGRYRQCYITDDTLSERVKTFNSTNEVEIREKIPDVNETVKSGEFGELLSYYILPERYPDRSFLAPMKWHWKEDKNMPAHFSDVILFSKYVNNPSPIDLIVCCESKMRSTRPPANKNPIQEAINGSENDYVTRLASTLLWLKTKYKDALDVESVNLINRYIDSPKHGTYLKHFKAVATVDSSFIDQLIEDDFTIPEIKDHLEVIVIGVTDLNVFYKRTYDLIPLH